MHLWKSDDAIFKGVGKLRGEKVRGDKQRDSVRGFNAGCEYQIARLDSARRDGSRSKVSNYEVMPRGNILHAWSLCNGVWMTYSDIN